MHNIDSILCRVRDVKSPYEKKCKKDEKKVLTNGGVRGILSKLSARATAGLKKIDNF